MFLSHPQGKRTTFDGLKGEGGELSIQLYGRSASIAPINGTVAERLCDVQY